MKLEDVAVLGVGMTRDTALQAYEESGIDLAHLVGGGSVCTVSLLERE